MKNVVIIVVSILTIVFLLVADVIALLVYPVYAWHCPHNASMENSLVSVLNWSWLVDIVNPGNSYRSSLLLKFFQGIMRPIDAIVVKFWNWVFFHTAPMKKRKFFIDEMGNRLQELPEKVQSKYFRKVDFDRKVYLVRNNMLSPSLLPQLYEEEKRAFVYAGKITDEQFENLCEDLIRLYCAHNDLSLQKQHSLVQKAVMFPAHLGSVLKRYILRKGLHPSAVEYFYICTKHLEKMSNDLLEIPVALQLRQDLTTVLQSKEENNAFANYLKHRGMLGYEAQVEMKPWQYKIFHEQGFKMEPKAVYAKLARVNKTEEATEFVALMMSFGEFEGDDVATHQVAGSEKLTSMWMQHLAETA